MVLDKLGDSLKTTLSKIKNSIVVDRSLVEEVVKEVQKALLSSDVNVRLVLDLTKKIRDRAISEDNKALDKREHLITIIYEELAQFLGSGDEFELKRRTKPNSSSWSLWTRKNYNLWKIRDIFQKSRKKSCPNFNRHLEASSI